MIRLILLTLLLVLTSKLALAGGHPEISTAIDAVLNLFKSLVVAVLDVVTSWLRQV